MENKFELAVTPDYRKVIRSVIILMLTCVILPPALFGISLEYKWLNPANFRFDLVLPIYIGAVALITLLVISKTSFKDTITLTEKSLIIPKLRAIDYSEISINKQFTAKGYSSYIVTLKDGKKLAFAPRSNFSNSAEKAFRDFVLALEKKLDKS